MSQLRVIERPLLRPPKEGFATALLSESEILPGTGRCPNGAEGSQVRDGRCRWGVGTPPSLRATSPFRGGLERSAFDARAQLNQRPQCCRQRTVR